MGESKAEQTQREFNELMQAALREPGVASVLELHEAVERAGGEVILPASDVYSANSTSPTPPRR